MNNAVILNLESRIDSINNAIAVTRANATLATKATAEMAIETLALPELAKVEAELAEAKEKLANMDKLLNNPIFKERK
tara:strand:- start:439 stop:672 length:234 start_codon:yes stop_codon:yes gene_type:complete